MKYLKLFNESNKSGRDLTDFIFKGNAWVSTNKEYNYHGYWYKEIEKKFQIKKDELEWILSEFVEDFNLLYRVSIQTPGYPQLGMIFKRDSIAIQFMPYSYLNNDSMYLIKTINFKKYIESQGEFRGIFYSMEERLNDYGLTIKIGNRKYLDDDDNEYLDDDDYLDDYDNNLGYTDEDEDEDENENQYIFKPLPEYNFAIYDCDFEHDMLLIIRKI